MKNELLKSNRPYPAIHRFQPTSSDVVQRLIILDGANVIRGTNLEDVYGIHDLIAFLRLLTFYDFDIYCVLLSNVFELVKKGKKMIERLEEMDVINILINEEFDDVIMFELSRTTHGIVLSNDRYKDLEEEKQIDLEEEKELRVAIGKEEEEVIEDPDIYRRIEEGGKEDDISDSEYYEESKISTEDNNKRFARLVRENRCGLSYHSVNPLPTKPGFLTADGHYVGNFFFCIEDPERLFCSPEDDMYELCQERRTLFTEEKKRKILKACDEMLEEIRTWKMEEKDEDSTEGDDEQEEKEIEEKEEERRRRILKIKGRKQKLKIKRIQKEGARRVATGKYEYVEKERIVVEYDSSEEVDDEDE